VKGRLTYWGVISGSSECGFPVKGEEGRKSKSCKKICLRRVRRRTASSGIICKEAGGSSVKLGKNEKNAFGAQGGLN